MIRTGLAAFLLLVGSVVQAAAGIGVVTLHGKWGSPPGPIAAQLERSGVTVVSVEMPWSAKRQYDVTYEQALGEVKTEVDKLRQLGLKKVVIVGHSFGANAALAYMKVHGDVDGLILFAPGHVPEIWYPKNKGTGSVNQARESVKSGKPEALVSFPDFNTGNRSKEFSRRADIVLSYMDPEGLGNMPLSASKITKAVPVLCVMSTEDRRGRNYIFDRLPQSEKSRYLETSASHIGTPEAHVGEALEFLKTL